MSEHEQPESPDGSVEANLRERLPLLFRSGQVGRCVSSVTHDVNNYLGAILAYAELVQQDPEIKDEPRRMLGNIVKSVHKCSDLLKTLTAVARKEKADVNVIGVPAFLEQILDLKRHESRVARVNLSLDCPAEMPSLVVDRPKLMMAILYLLANALDAVEGIDPRRIVMTAEKLPDCIAIQIRDTGPGVPEAQRERIFEPFYSTKPGEHLGLGLSLARDIAVYHGGTLDYDEARGFVLRLPLVSPLKM